MGMNRVVFQSAPVMGGSTSGGWWNLNNNMRGSPSDHTSSTTPLLPSPSLSGSLHDYPYHPSTNSLPNSSPNWQDSHPDLPESWSQLLLGGLVEGDGRGSFPSFQAPVLNPHMVDVKQERPENGYMYGQGSEEFQLAINKGSWNQIPPVSSPSPRSSVTSFSSNMLDFSNINADGRQKRPDNSPECNSTAAASAFKKARIQGSSSAQSTFKVRKEKLGDRITALHQLVSPFGKTDTASVLQEAIGYIRFLQSQIEALSSPYLGNATHTNTPGNSRNTGQGERSCIFPEDPGQLLNDAFMKRRGSTDQKEGEENEEVQKKDLKSRGLCLVPISCTMHIGSDNGADYWAPALGSAFL